jgi:hypothetical protein
MVRLVAIEGEGDERGDLSTDSLIAGIMMFVWIYACTIINKMTPLGASLIFVFISILVSLFRHLFFHSSSINGSDDSNIAFTKLHTITITQNVQQRQPYNSLY